jgi:HK97 family phage major capsid protein
MGLKVARQRVADLKAEIAAARKARAAIGETAIAEKRSMTDDERAKFAEAKAKIDGLEAQLADAEEILASAEQANEAERQVIARPDPDSQAAASAAARAGVVAVRDNAQDDPKRGFRDHREFMQCVMDAGRGRRVDRRLVPLQAAAGSDEQGEYSDPHGGYLVPHGVAPGILSIGAEADPLGGLTRQITMTAPTVSFNARVDKDHTTSVSGGLVVTRRPETVDGASSRMKFDQVTLTANEEFGLAFASERILADSPISFVELISAGFGDEFVANRMRERASGSGVGERQGWLQAGCKIAVAKESGQSAATIVKANVDNMAARCWRYSQAVWVANHSTRPQLKSLVQVVGTGGNSVPYFVSSPSGQETLDGRPIIFTEFAEAVGTEGDLVLIVPSEYLEGTYRMLETAESIHVRFAAAERAFRFYQRNDGQWWWKTALTPKKGSTLSPVVTLATRG